MTPQEIFETIMQLPYEPQPVGLVYPRYKVINREQDRRYIHQAKRVAGKLEDIEDSFVSCLFLPDAEYRYLYAVHKQMWDNTIEFYKDRLPDCVINENYFEITYKPLEKYVDTDN